MAGEHAAQSADIGNIALWGLAGLDAVKRLHPVIGMAGCARPAGIGDQPLPRSHDKTRAKSGGNRHFGDDIGRAEPFQPKACPDPDIAFPVLEQRMDQIRGETARPAPRVMAVGPLVKDRRTRHLAHTPEPFAAHPGAPQGSVPVKQHRPFNA
jgi:hypothetical protein